MSQTKPAKAATKPAATESDWTKLWPSANPRKSEPLLKALHILTRDGALNADSRRKLTQVLHLTQLLKPAIEAMLKEKDDPILADLGAGKSYLGFILYDLIIGPAGKGRVIGVETRDKLVETSRALAQQSGFDRLDFITAPIAEANLPGGHADMVTALHACDTATDDAIRFALARQARHIVLVPCCQAEAASVLRKYKNEALGRTPLSEIWRHPLHAREFGSHITNVLRCLLLEAHGYQLTVTELVGWEHSMKNELILARATGHPRGNARERAEKILAEAHLESLRERFIY